MGRRYNRYAAKLLFQFRVGSRALGRRHLCEERTIVLRAGSPRQALGKAKSAGKTAHLTYTNDCGEKVHFEFVGVLGLLHLGRECDRDEVWYDIKRMTDPMRRRAKLVPSDAELLFRAT